MTSLVNLRSPLSNILTNRNTAGNSCASLVSFRCRRIYSPEHGGTGCDNLLDGAGFLHRAGGFESVRQRVGRLVGKSWLCRCDDKHIENI